MATAPFSIIAGPAKVYIAPVGTAFPAINVAPPGSWVYVGYTEGGVTVRHTQSVELLMADQSGRPLKAIRPEEGLEIEFAFVQSTLENYRYALNNNTVTTDAGPPAIKRIDLARGVDVNQHALLVRGPSAYANLEAQYQVPVVVQTDEPEIAFVRDDKAVLAIVFSALEDPNAVAGQEFGRLIHQTA